MESRNKKDRTPIRSKAKAAKYPPPTIRLTAVSAMPPEDQRRLESLVRLLVERRVRRLLEGETS